MNRFDKPLSAASAIVTIVAALGVWANIIRGANNQAIIWLALASFAGAIMLLVSGAAYRKWHTHTSIVTGIWTERRPREHKPGRSFQSLTEVYPEVAVMRLKSGGTYALGDVNDATLQPLEVRVGDTVIVQRAWGATNGHWHTQILSVVSADKLRPAKKADH